MPSRLAVLSLLLVQACTPAPAPPSKSATAERVKVDTTCFGQPATIVVRDDDSETLGTSGPDVIISYGGGVDSGDGNDLVCVFGTPKSDRELYGRYIETGDGDDRVDTRG